MLLQFRMELVDLLLLGCVPREFVFKSSKDLVDTTLDGGTKFLQEVVAQRAQMITVAVSFLSKRVFH